jgi:hypothetical protein
MLGLEYCQVPQALVCVIPEARRRSRRSSKQLPVRGKALEVAELVGLYDVDRSSSPEAARIGNAIDLGRTNRLADTENLPLPTSGWRRVDLR